MGTKDARIHTGRNDRDGRARATDRRKAESLPLCEAPRCWDSFSEFETQACGCATCENWVAAKASAGDEGVDDVHPRDEG